MASLEPAASEIRANVCCCNSSPGYLRDNPKRIMDHDQGLGFVVWLDLLIGWRIRIMLGISKSLAGSLGAKTPSK